MSRVPGRGQRGSSLPGTTLFITLRTLDMVLQCYLIWHWQDTVTLLTKLSAVTGGRLLGTTSFSSWDSSGDYQEKVPLLSLQKSSLPRFSMMAFSIAIWLKHVYWLLWTCKEPMYVSAASIISFVNLFVNTSHTIAFFLSSIPASHNTSLAFGSPTSNMIIGWTAATIGFYIDIVSETQRKNFKDQQEKQQHKTTPSSLSSSNKNTNTNNVKIYTKGLFQHARHINYTGFILWRSGQAHAAAGPLWGLTWLCVFTLDFWYNGIPELEGHMAAKYGEEWEIAKRKVRYFLVPGVL